MFIILPETVPEHRAGGRIDADSRKKDVCGQPEEGCMRTADGRQAAAQGGISMKDDLKKLKRFFCIFRSQWAPYIISTLAVASRNFAITFINAMISSKVIAMVSSRTSIVDPIVNIVIWVVCFAAADAAGVYFQTAVIHRISMILREKMLSHALGVSVSDIDRFGRREELVARMNFDIEHATRLLSYGLLTPLMYCISGIGATAIVLRENWKICVGIYVLGMAAFFAQMLCTKLMRRYMTEIQKVKSAILSVSMQTFLNSAGIRMAGMMQYVAGMHSDRIRRYDRAFSRKGIVDGAYGAVQGVLGLACFFGVFCYGLFGAGMELEEVVFISQITPLIGTMILSLSGCVANLLSSMAGVDRLLELFDLLPEENKGEEFEVRQMERGIETEGLACRYQDKEVRIADIRVGSGDGGRIALIGPSGCGKTTFLRLLLKLYPCSGGTLRFFGQDIGSCSCESVRGRIAYVPQENVIFSGTVRENILLGNHRSKITEEEILDVLEQIGADGWVKRIGLDSVLKENGGNLSGGQRQMIAIARAILYKKPILVLDEAFASVDEEHIEKIMGLLSEMQEELYVMIVTHDNRVVERCSGAAELQAMS